MAKARKNTGSTTGDLGTTGGEGATVVGLFRDRHDAERAIGALKDAGFTEDQIGVALRDRGEQKDLMDRTDTKAAEGATTGAVGGGVVGGTLGLLGGLGALVIPGLGPIFAAGWLGSTLAGAGIGAAAGGLIGGLVGMDIPEEDARHFETGFKSGGTLVTVRAGARSGEAESILRRFDADLGPTRGRAFDRGATATGRAAGLAGESREAMQLREEQLNVNKERVQTGEVTLRKEVVTEQKRVDVPVTREEVVIERRPVAGEPTRAGDISDLREGEEIRVPIMEEQVHVEKTQRVKEEVRLGKREVEGVEHVQDTVRHEEARVEGTGGAHRVDAGGLGFEAPRAWDGTERRRSFDSSYAGPERRLAHA